jgi:hypothetical protein
MSAKRLTILIYGPDRDLWQGGKATLTVTRVEPGNARELKRVVLPPKTSTVNVSMNPHFDRDQSYLIVLTSAKHRTAWCAVTHETFIRRDSGVSIEREEAFLRLLLVPNKTSMMDETESYTRMLEAASPFVTSPGLPLEAYSALKPAAKMAVLNIEAKLRDTRIGGISLLSMVCGIHRPEVDRVFLLMTAEAKRLVRESAEFVSAGGHPGHPDSWKHNKYPAGNLQLSFARDPHPAGGTLAFSVDVDIDLAKGAAHVIEWLDNNVFEVNKTDQTRVYALLYGQGITPYYRLKGS